MDHKMNGKRVHMYSNKNFMKHNTHQETEQVGGTHMLNNNHDHFHVFYFIVVILFSFNFFHCYFVFFFR